MGGAEWSAVGIGNRRAVAGIAGKVPALSNAPSPVSAMGTERQTGAGTGRAGAALARGIETRVRLPHMSQVQYFVPSGANGRDTRFTFPSGEVTQDHTATVTDERSHVPLQSPRETLVEMVPLKEEL